MSVSTNDVALLEAEPPNIKNSEWDLDEVLTYLQFGSYQLKNLFLMGLLCMFSNVHSLSFTLTTADVDYRCLVPECENANFSDLQYLPSWIRDAVPYTYNQPSKCERFQSERNVTVHHNSTCPATFNSHEKEICNEWVFATDEVTIVNDFGIFCENRKWQLSMIGTIHSIGQFIATPVFSILPDKFGRKHVVIWCSVISAVFGILRGLSTNYVMFAVFEFLDAFFSCALYSIAYMLGLEIVDQKMRSFAATLMSVFYPLGAAIMGCIAWYYQNWRKILIISYSPALLFILYFWLIPESIRWLQTKGRHKETHSILQKISLSNNVELPETFVIQEQKQLSESQLEEEAKKSVWESLLIAFQSRNILLRLLNCSFSWFTNDLVYFGLSMISVELVGHKYFNFVLTNLVEIPAIILAGFIMNRVKRRISLSSICISCGITCILCELVPSDMFILKIIFYQTSKFLITMSYCIIHIFTAEMFPTELRLSMTGVATWMGCIAMMLAPQTILLKDLAGEHAPVILFGILCVIAGASAVFFPETFNKKLPDTLYQANLDDECDK